MEIVSLVFSLFSIICAVIAIVFSLIDTHIFMEYLFSKEYILIHSRDGKRPTKANDVTCYTTNIGVFGLIETGWYTLNVSDDDLIHTANYATLKDMWLIGSNLQEECDYILITRAAKQKLKRMIKKKS